MTQPLIQARVRSASYLASSVVNQALLWSLVFKWREYVQRGLCTVDEAVRLAGAEYNRRKS